jgi:hypothetical protein
MKAKVLKAQLNDLCLGGMVLDMNRVNLYSGFSKMNVVEISQHGINIQTEFGQPIVLNSPIINGPGFTYVTSPIDFVPFTHIALPKKTIAPINEIKDNFMGVLGVSALLVAAGALR